MEQVIHVGRSLGSAKYFGQFLAALRGGLGQNDVSGWATTAGLDPEKYQRLENGEEPKPDVEEVNNWARNWNLNREQIIYMKMAGDYDISAYTGQLTSETLAAAMEELLEENRRMPFTEKAKMYAIVFGVLVKQALDAVISKRKPK